VGEAQPPLRCSGEGEGGSRGLERLRLDFAQCVCFSPSYSQARGSPPPSRSGRQRPNEPALGTASREDSLARGTASPMLTARRGGLRQPRSSRLPLESARAWQSAHPVDLHLAEPGPTCVSLCGAPGDSCARRGSSFRGEGGTPRGGRSCVRSRMRDSTFQGCPFRAPGLPYAATPTRLVRGGPIVRSPLPHHGGA
jgi:hypothetical protein